MSIIPIVQAAIDSGKLGSILDPIINNIVNPVVWLMFGVAVVYFTYGVLKMVIKGSDETARSESKQSILWGLIGMLIMLSAWGIIYVVANTIRQIG
jgi:zinc transporter ZupT